MTTGAMPFDFWTISSNDSDYPQRLVGHARSAEWSTLFGIGRRTILDERCLGLVCSIKCPGAAVIKTYDAIRELRDASIVVAGGFHSPMERECLDFLLRGKQPVIICPARNTETMRVPTAWREGLECGRVLVVSCFGRDIRRATQSSASLRNELVAALSAAVLIPHATQGGKADAIAQDASHNGLPIFTFGDDDNRLLGAGGALLYDLGRIESIMSDPATQPQRITTSDPGITNK